MPREKLKHLGERIDGMSARERVFVFAAAIMVALALVQTLLIDPALERQQRARERIQGAQAAMQQIAQQTAAVRDTLRVDPDRAARDALAAEDARLAELAGELEARERLLIAPERMQQVLKDVVRGHGGIHIVGFKTLSPQAVSLPDAVDGAPPGFYRHGFEVTVRGPYAELVAYLERLEGLPWRLSWSAATLDAAARPVLSLTLLVNTLSLEEAWLRV